MIQQKHYQQHEVEYLEDNYEKYSNVQLAEKLNRTVTSVNDKLTQLGLKITRELKPISKSGKPDIKKIEEHIEILYNTKCMHPEYISNLIKYWYGRIDKLKEEQRKTA